MLSPENLKLPHVVAMYNIRPSRGVIASRSCVSSKYLLL